MSEETRTKVCTRCGKEKPMEAYYWNKRRNRYEAQCKQCRAESRRQRRERHFQPGDVFRDKHGRLMQRTACGAPRLYWTANMLADIRRYFPDTNDAEAAEIIGVSVSVYRRKAAELGLVKSAEYVKAYTNNRIMLARARNKELGYPNSFKNRGLIYKGNYHTGRTLVAVAPPNNPVE